MDSVEIGDPLPIPAGRHTLSPEEVGALQRERLVRAVTACCAQNGYATTTIGDIVALAEVSRSAFYEQFARRSASSLPMRRWRWPCATP